MGLADKIRADVKKSGQNRGKFIYFREGVKTRVRFLDDMEDGLEIPFHDSYELGVNVPCQELFDKSCKYHDDEDLRHRSMYCWSVYDYESKEVKLFMFAVNNCSPIPALMAMFETYGTITDRDYVISCAGKQTNKTFSVVPMDKAKFRNSKVKPYSESQVLKMLEKAYPADDDSDDDEDYKPKRKKAAKKVSKNDDDDWGDDYDAPEDDVPDYSEMSPKELYTLCEERGIDAEKKKPAKYYVRLLEEYDEAQDDWGDDDEWEDE